MATSQNQEPGTNGFHDGDPLSERMKKYQIDDDVENVYREETIGGIQSAALFQG